MRSQRKNKTKHTHTRRPRMHIKCVSVFLLTLIYLMHWLSRRINAKGIALLFSSAFCSFCESLSFGVCVCVCTAVVVVVSSSIYYFSAASYSSSTFRFYHLHGFSSICYLFLDEFGWRRCPTTDNVSVFFLSCISLHSRMYVCRFWVRFQRPSEKNVKRNEKEMNDIQRPVAMTMQ